MLSVALPSRLARRCLKQGRETEAAGRVCLQPRGTGPYQGGPGRILNPKSSLRCLTLC